MIEAFDYNLGAFASQHSSLNHSYICAQILRQLLQDKTLDPLPFVTLALEEGITPDISVFEEQEIDPDFFKDINQVKILPRLVIEVLTANQALQVRMDRANRLLAHGVPVVWVVESWSKSVFEITSEKHQLFHQTIVNSKGIAVDFAKVFRSK